MDRGCFKFLLFLVASLCPLSLALGQGNQPPTIRIVKPLAAPFLQTGQTIPYEIEVEDAEDGFSIYEEISPSEIFLELRVLKSREEAMHTSEAAESPAIGLVKANDCLTCHQVRNRYMGPSFKEIAEKHSGVIAPMVESIRKGSRGQWGDTAVMPSHANLSDTEVEAIAEWIAALKSSDPFDLMAGTSGIIQLDASFAGQYLWMRASYRDKGGEASPPLQSTADQVYLLR